MKKAVMFIFSMLMFMLVGLAAASTGVTAPETGGFLSGVANFFRNLPDGTIVLTVGTVVSSVLTAFLPTRSKNKILDTVLKIANYIACNVGKNKNVDDIDPRSKTIYSAKETLDSIRDMEVNKTAKIENMGFFKTSTEKKKE